MLRLDSVVSLGINVLLYWDSLERGLVLLVGACYCSLSRTNLGIIIQGLDIVVPRGLSVLLLLRGLIL